MNSPISFRNYTNNKRIFLQLAKKMHILTCLKRKIVNVVQNNYWNANANALQNVLYLYVSCITMHFSKFL